VESIRFWGNRRRTADSLLHVISPGKTWTSEENLSRIRQALQQSPHKSIRAASLQLHITCSIVHNVLHKRLCHRAYKIQMIHVLKPSDQATGTNFTVDMLERTDASPNFLHQMCFLEEVTFCVYGLVKQVQLQDLLG
jgi:hypothetical protein